MDGFSTPPDYESRGRTSFSSALNSLLTDPRQTLLIPMTTKIFLTRINRLIGAWKEYLNTCSCSTQTHSAITMQACRWDRILLSPGRRDFRVCSTITKAVCWQ